MSRNKRKKHETTTARTGFDRNLREQIEGTTLDYDDAGNRERRPHYGTKSAWYKAVRLG